MSNIWAKGILLYFICFFCMAKQSFIVIVNINNPQKIDREFIKNVSSDIISTWDNGDQIKIYLPKEKSEARNAFAHNVLGISANLDVRNWQNKKITNTLNNKMPKQLSDKMIIRMVAKHKEAFGYISAASLNNNPNIKSVLRY